MAIAAIEMKGVFFMIGVAGLALRSGAPPGSRTSLSEWAMQVQRRLGRHALSSMKSLRAAP